MTTNTETPQAWNDIELAQTRSAADDSFNARKARVLLVTP
jgi:hypothetical protein